MLGLLILKSLYFCLPAYLGNMVPIFVKKIPLLNYPVWEKKFGKNKTWRGTISAIIIGMIVFALQKYAYSQGFTEWALIDYNGFSVLLGALLGGGAIIGDLAESYFKRKQGIKPGERWLFWDQIDFVIGGLLLACLVYVPPAEVVLILIVLSPFLHVFFNHLGYFLKIRKSKW